MMKYIADRSVDELGRIILPTQIREFSISNRGTN